MIFRSSPKRFKLSSTLIIPINIHYASTTYARNSTLRLQSANHLIIRHSGILCISARAVANRSKRHGIIQPVRFARHRDRSHPSVLQRGEFDFEGGHRCSTLLLPRRNPLSPLFPRLQPCTVTCVCKFILAMRPCAIHAVSGREYTSTHARLRVHLQGHSLLALVVGAA